ncbi:MAG TPA: GNAT family N-acetyltransferase, partial [Gammaproteobacteria bacterium]
EIGYIGYFGLNNWRGLAELEICIASSMDWGRGWGTRAIRRLADQLLVHATVENVIARPSPRSRRAIAAFRKAGFVDYDRTLHRLPTWIFTVGLNYRDAVVLLRKRDSSKTHD